MDHDRLICVWQNTNQIRLNWKTRRLRVAAYFGEGTLNVSRFEINANKQLCLILIGVI